MRIAVLVCSACLCACAQTPPLQVSATGREQTCALRLDNVDVSREALDPNRLRALGAAHRRRAVVDTDPETPYRCVGGIIYDLQRAGFRIVAVTVNGVPVPVR